MSFKANDYSSLLGLIGHVAGAIQLLVLDLWEHAMLLDYGSARKSYIDAFFRVIDWGTVSSRFEKALEPLEIP